MAPQDLVRHEAENNEMVLIAVNTAITQMYGDLLSIFVCLKIQPQTIHRFAQ